MKKMLSILLSCSMLIAPFSTYAVSNNSSYIESSEEIISKSKDDSTNSIIDNQFARLKNVVVNFNESPLESDFPAVLYENRTIVPLRAIAEATGAKVDWNSVNKGITIESGDKTLYLEIDSQFVSINGVKKNIDYGIPPKLIKEPNSDYSTTMVPLRFISEEIGCDVDWDENAFCANITYAKLGSIPNVESKLLGINSKDLNLNQLSSIELSLDSNSSPRAYVSKENPNRIVVDIPDSQISIDGNSSDNFKSDICKFPVESISASQLNDGTVRVNMDLSTEIDFKTDFKTTFEGGKFSVTFPKIPLNSLDYIGLESRSGRKAIVLHSTDIPDYKFFELPSDSAKGIPKRVVLDLKSTLLNTSDLVLGSNGISKVRTSQYKNSAEYGKSGLVTRVVLDLKNQSDNFSYSVELMGNDIVIFVPDEVVSPSVPDTPADDSVLGGNPSVPSPSDEKVSYTNYNMTVDEMVKAQSLKLTVTDKYRNEAAYIYKDDIETTNGVLGMIITDNTPVRSQPNAMSFVYNNFRKGSFVNIIETTIDKNWYKVQCGTWRNAKPEDIRHYLNPDNFKPNTASALQFLNLSKSSDISASELNKSVLKNKGILSGKGDAFVSAGKKHSVNEIYLVSHAFLETGSGSSQLARGVLVSSVDGKPVEPKTVYNMFGIGAIDSNALKYGSEKAYKEGWFSPEDAIIGGAKFISEQYLSRGQNTLYEMRWNPDINKIYHQYATDIGWAYKQVGTMNRLYDMCSGYTLKYDMPVYKK